MVWKFPTFLACPSGIGTSKWRRWSNGNWTAVIMQQHSPFSIAVTFTPQTFPLLPPYLYQKYERLLSANFHSHKIFLLLAINVVFPTSFVFFVFFFLFTFFLSFLLAFFLLHALKFFILLYQWLPLASVVCLPYLKTGTLKHASMFLFSSRYLK